MKFRFLFLLAISAIYVHGQQAAWFDVGTTWTYNYNLAFDPNQDDFTTEFFVSEQLLFNGKNCSKIDANGSDVALGCSAIVPPYYSYVSGDSVFFATEQFPEFELAYIFHDNLSVEYSYFINSNTLELSQGYIVNAQPSFMVEIEGTTVRAQFPIFEPIGDPMIEMPLIMEILEFAGHQRDFIFPIGRLAACDLLSNVRLRCYNSPTLDYIAPTFPGCILSNAGDNERFQIKVYPNPAADEIRWDAAVEGLEIFDLNGRNIRSAQGAELRSIDISDLDAGIYFIQFKIGDTIGNQKFVVGR